jgi:hypothetical protein
MPMPMRSILAHSRPPSRQLRCHVHVPRTHIHTCSRGWPPVPRRGHSSLITHHLPLIKPSQLRLPLTMHVRRWPHRAPIIIPSSPHLRPDPPALHWHCTAPHRTALESTDPSACSQNASAVRCGSNPCESLLPDSTTAIMAGNHGCEAASDLAMPIWYMGALSKQLHADFLLTYGHMRRHQLVRATTHTVYVHKQEPASAPR